MTEREMIEELLTQVWTLINNPWREGTASHDAVVNKAKYTAEAIERRIKND